MEWPFHIDGTVVCVREDRIHFRSICHWAENHSLCSAHQLLRLLKRGYDRWHHFPWLASRRLSRPSMTSSIGDPRDDALSCRGDTACATPVSPIPLHGSLSLAFPPFLEK
ncbi:hypothetical protein SEVIR_9G257638v4 [Setaria viridis]